LAERDQKIRGLKSFGLDDESLKRGIVVSHYMIFVFGKDDCPYTTKARQDYKKQCKPFIYVNVDNNPQGLEKMLEYSNGDYVVPVIVNVDEDNVEIGYTD
jgi:glutaredoxin